MRLKGVERAWKRAWLRLLAAASARPARPGAPDWDARRWRVLYLRYDRIGDMILATGLLRAIATSHSTIELDVLASPSNAPVLAGNPHVGRIHVFHRKRRSTWPRLLRELRAARYDVVIDGMVLTPSLTTLLIMLATGAPYRVGVGGRENDFVYTLPVAPAPPDAHMVEHSGATAAPFGVDLSRADWRSELHLTDAERARADEIWRDAGATGRRLLVNISSAQARNRWPDERFVAALIHVRARHPDVRAVVVGAPAEGAAIREIAARAGTAAAPEATLREAMAMAASADAVLTPDTSIAHAAAAFRTPSVVMILPRVRQFVPYRAPGRALFADGDTLAALPTDPVVEALDEMLGRDEK